MIKWNTLNIENFEEVVRSINKEVDVQDCLTEFENESFDALFQLLLDGHYLDYHTYVTKGQDNSVYAFIICEDCVKYAKVAKDKKILTLMPYDNNMIVILEDENGFLHAELLSSSLVEIASVTITDKDYNKVSLEQIIFIEFVDRIPYILTSDSFITYYDGEMVYNNRINSSTFIAHFVFNNRIIVFYKTRFGLVRAYVSIVENANNVNTVDHKLNRKYKVLYNNGIDKFETDTDTLYLLCGGQLCSFTYRINSDKQTIYSENYAITIKNSMAVDMKKLRNKIYLVSVHHSVTSPSTFGIVFVSQIQGNKPVQIGQTYIRYTGLIKKQIKLMRVARKSAFVVDSSGGAMYIDLDKDLHIYDEKE